VGPALSVLPETSGSSLPRDSAEQIIDPKKEALSTADTLSPFNLTISKLHNLYLTIQLQYQWSILNAWVSQPTLQKFQTDPTTSCAITPPINISTPSYEVSLPFLSTNWSIFGSIPC
jgi:hypothetical protein